MSKDEKFYEGWEFRALQREWYAKLKEDGFQDSEQIAPDGEMYWGLVSHAGCFSASADAYRCYTPEKERYYELARSHYWEIENRHSLGEYRDAFYVYSHLAVSMNKTAEVMGLPFKKVRDFIKEQEAIFLPKL